MVWVNSGLLLNQQIAEYNHNRHLLTAELKGALLVVKSIPFWGTVWEPYSSTTELSSSSLTIQVDD